MHALPALRLSAHARHLCPWDPATATQLGTYALHVSPTYAAAVSRMMPCPGAEPELEPASTSTPLLQPPRYGPPATAVQLQLPYPASVRARALATRLPERALLCELRVEEQRLARLVHVQPHKLSLHCLAALLSLQHAAAGGGQSHLYRRALVRCR